LNAGKYFAVTGRIEWETEKGGGCEFNAEARRGGGRRGVIEDV
jgi:hypothetical protein